MMSVGLHCRLPAAPAASRPRPLPRPRPVDGPTSGSPPAARSPPTGAPATRAAASPSARPPSRGTPSSPLRRRLRALALDRRARLRPQARPRPRHRHRPPQRALPRLPFRLPRERLGVLKAHPDLAGKLAAAKRLTAELTAEQAGAGLDSLTDAERARFTELNDAYQAKFGFPFIIAVRGLDQARILRAFEPASATPAT